MREASTRGRLKSESSYGAAFAPRGAALALLTVFCLLLTACPVDGGDLTPIRRSDDSDLASVETTKFENDTLAVERNSVAILARGHWSVADDAVSVILEASNNNAEALTIDFNHSELTRDDGRRLSLRSLSRERTAGGAEFLPDKTAQVEGREEDTFTLEFAGDANTNKDPNASNDLLGRTVTLRVPVELKDGTMDFVFGFKYGERQPPR
jgi:hypothetical protein